MDKEKLRLVIDQSTSGTKMLLVKEHSGQLEILSRIDKMHRQIYPKEGWVEHDPEEIFQNIETLIDVICKKNEIDLSMIESLSITNQRETIVAWDKRTGEPLSNALVWQCNRSAKICQEMINEGYEPLLQKKTGLKIDSYFSAPKIKWLLQNCPKIYEAQEESRLSIGTMDSWLIWNLTNGKTFATEPSNASRTLLYNIYKNEWDVELCDLFGVSRDCLPEVRDSDAFFGEYQGVPIIGAMADSQAALYGQGCSSLGEVKATLGTGSSVLMQIKQEVGLGNDRILKTIAYKTKETTDYALEGIIRSCGDIINWLQVQLGMFDSVEEAIDQAFSIVDSGGVYFIPAQLGLAAPFWDSEIRASFVGISRNTGKRELIRAGFESAFFQVRAVVDEMERVSHLPIKHIKVDGGMTKSDLLMQLMADILERDIVVSAIEELSALGVLAFVTKSRISLSGKKIFSPIYDNINNYEHWLEWIIKTVNCNNR